MNNKTEMSSAQQEQPGLPLLNNDEIDYESIRLEMSESKTGSKNGSLTSDGEKFSFQVDGSTVYSASRYPRDGEGPNVSYSLTIEFDGESAKQIQAFEERIKNIIFDNHKAVFGKSYSKDQKSVVSALCNGFLNDKEQLRFNIRTAYKSNKFSVVVSENDESETVSTFEELEKRIQRNMLVSVIGYVRFYFDRNGKFANSFMCEAIKIRGEGEKKEYQKKDNVIPIEDLDISSLKASKPQKNEGGKLKSEISLNGSKWFKLRLTNLYGKFGVSTGIASEGQDGGKKYSIHSSFSNEDPIYQKLKEIDSFSVEHGTFYSEEIFGKKFGPKLIEGKLKKCLNEKLGASGDGDEVTYISANLSLYTMNDKPNIKVIDSKTGNEISVATFDELSECFPEGTYFDAIVKLNFYYYSTTVLKNSTVSTPTNFGLKMYITELHIAPRLVEKKSFVFRSGSKDDSAPLTRTASASAPSKEVVASRNSDEEEESGDGDEIVSKPEPKSSKKETVPDSDEEEDEEEEESEEEAPAPAPAPTAKTVRKGADPLPVSTPVKKVVSSRK